MSAAGFVLGLDVGWSTARRSSAACLLGWTAHAVEADIVRFTADPADYMPRLAALVGERPLLAAALDGPLRGDLAEIGRYRLGERLLTRGLARHIGKPGQSNSPNGRILNRAASAYARHLLDRFAIADSRHAAAIHGRAVAEAFPTSFLGTMLDAGFRERGRARSDSYFVRLTGDDRGCRLSRLVGALLPGRSLAFAPGILHNHDDRAALVCAVTALCVAQRRYTAVGDDQGWIVLPPRLAGGAGMADWAWAILQANAAAEGAAVLAE
ncbi:MAG: hypothetical protein R3F55_09320 [Alphaproteobacteria bacterium]